jgi:hypothetical protein
MEEKLMLYRRRTGRIIVLSILVLAIFTAMLGTYTLFFWENEPQPTATPTLDYYWGGPFKVTRSLTDIAEATASAESLNRINTLQAQTAEANTTPSP